MKRGAMMRVSVLCTVLDRSAVTYFYNFMIVYNLINQK